jgi:hypothetical protein
LSKRARISISEANAPVRFSLADTMWLRGSVDAISVSEIDPRSADRIVWARGNVERLPRLHSLELQAGSVMVRGIFLDETNGPCTTRSGTLSTSDGRRIKADYLAVATQGSDRLGCLIHHDFDHLRI